MKTSFPFYKSLRFRFGAIFGSLLLCSLLLIGVFLFARVKNEFETGFYHLMNEQAAVILDKVELNPLTLPAPQPGEKFSLFYDHAGQTDTLFRNKKNSDGNAGGEYQRSVTRRRLPETGGVLRIEYTQDSRELESQIAELRSVIFIYFPLAFLCALLAGYFLSSFLLRPLSRIISRANETSLKDEIRLLPLPPLEDELHQLTVSFNRMLERIRDQSEQETAFFASAAHELRTPLSVMLTELQVLPVSTLPASLQEVIAHQVTEVQRLSALVNMFLLMSRVKAAPVASAEQQTSFSLQDELMDVLPAFQKKALEKEIVFRIGLKPVDADFSVLGNQEHIRVMLANVLENSVKFGLSARPVVLNIVQRPGSIRFQVSNETNDDIEDIQKLTERFVKGKLSSDGFGLGLFIVESLARANGVKMTLNAEGRVFTVTLDFNHT